ncbi:MAG: hypothetical protein IJF41_03620 [Clostridia bacterium]|nr:hypothetical protein [Clostridia bacterium]
MAFIIGCIPLYLLAMAISRKTHRSFAECLPLSVLGSVLLLYVFGLLGILSFGVYALCLLGFAALCFEIHCRLVQKKTTGKLCWDFTPDKALALLLIPAIAYCTRGRMITIWDEFSHWGTVVKNMYLLDQLGSAAASTAIYKSYPPAIGLLQYYFMKFSPAFSEGILFAAKDFFTLSLLLPFFREVRWKEPGRLALTFFLVLALPLVEYYYFYRSIHVDGIMGICIAYCLISYFGSLRRDSFAWVSVALGIFMLWGIKSSGLGMCILVLLIIYGDALLVRKEGLPLTNQKHRLYPLDTWLLPLVLLVFGKVSWEINLKLSGAVDYWNMSTALSPSNMLAMVKDPLPYQMETLERFFAALFALREDTYALKFSPLSWIILPMVPMAVSCLLLSDRQKKRRVSRTACFLLAGYGLWLLVLLISFLFVFADFEALNLDGFERYTSTYQLGMLIFCIWTLLETLGEAHRSKLTPGLSLVALALLMLFNGSDLMKATVVSGQYNNYSRTQRAENFPKAPDFSKLDPETDRVLFIGQQSEATGLDFYYLRYCETPVYVGMIGSWSIGAPYDGEDDWTAPFTFEEWTKAVYDSSYTHLYLFRVDDRFIGDYGAAFTDPASIRDDSLFTIQRTGNTVSFRPVD